MQRLCRPRSRRLRTRMWRGRVGRVCDHVDRVQERLGRRMLLENPATYVDLLTLLRDLYAQVPLLLGMPIIRCMEVLAVGLEDAGEDAEGPGLGQGRRAQDRAELGEPTMNDPSATLRPCASLPPKVTTTMSGLSPRAVMSLVSRILPPASRVAIPYSSHAAPSSDLPWNSGADMLG